MKKYTQVPFEVDTWEPDADGFSADLCTDCGTPVRYGSRHGHCLETKPLAPEVKTNDRIKKLTERARHWAHVEGLTLNPTLSPDILFEGKFAELIVKECAKIASDAFEVDGNCSHPGDEIEKHFGVAGDSRKFSEGTFVIDTTDFLYQKGLQDGATLERSKWKSKSDISDTDPDWVDPPVMW